jgi:alpha-beta hydrolase superfamily lysophospholipase
MRIQMILIFLGTMVEVSALGNIPMGPLYKHKEGFFESVDKQRLFYEVYEAKKAEKVILFVQGRTEFTKKYEHLVKENALGGENTTFVFYDVRGQGQSDGIRAHIDSFDTHVADLHTIISKIVPTQAPLWIIGHSTGALIALLYLETHPETFVKGVVLSSPLIAINMGKVPEFLPKVASKLMVKIGMETRPTAKENNHENRVTHDQELYEQFVSSPWVCGPPTFGWVNAVYEAIEKVKNQMAKIQPPILVMTAGQDVYVKSEDAQAFCMNMKRAGKACKLVHFGQMKHELLNELDRQKVFAEIKQFMKPKVGS